MTENIRWCPTCKVWKSVTPLQARCGVCQTKLTRPDPKTKVTR